MPGENRRALRSINDQITRLAPAVLGRKPQSAVTIRATGDVKLAVMAREHDGHLYLFAVNYDERQLEAAATIVVKSLPAGTNITVIDEARTLRSAAGSFTDTFAPLAVHLYRVD